MKFKSRIFLWLGFVTTSLLTWIVYDYLSYISFYVETLLVLAAIQVVLGLWLLKTARFAWRTVIFVVMGIIAGQWWFFLWGIVILNWRIRGFAP